MSEKWEQKWDVQWKIQQLEDLCMWNTDSFENIWETFKKSLDCNH